MKDGMSLGHIGDPTVAAAEFGEQWLRVISLALAELQAVTRAEIDDGRSHPAAPIFQRTA